MADSSLQSSQDSRPVPDPTVLTTEASIRLEAMLRVLIQAEIGHQQELFDEKFRRVEIRFAMLDARTAEQKKDTKDALDAALAAQKEAVASQTASSEKSITKSETATTERIKGVETQLANSTKATDDKITDLKDRIIVIESLKTGNVESVANARAGAADARGATTLVIYAILAAVAVAGFAIAIFKP